MEDFRCRSYRCIMNRRPPHNEGHKISATSTEVWRQVDDEGGQIMCSRTGIAVLGVRGQSIKTTGKGVCLYSRV